MLKQLKNFVDDLQKMKMLALSGEQSIFDGKYLVPKKYEVSFNIIKNLILQKGLSAVELINELIKVVKVEIESAEELEVGISEAKMQIKMLKILPIVGFSFGFLIGANPIKVIFTNIFGLISLTIGALFMLLGEKWTKKLILSTQKEIDIKFLLYISILKSCYLAGFSNFDTKEEASKIGNFKNEKLDEILKLTEKKGISPKELLEDLFNNVISENKQEAKLQIAKVSTKLMLPLGTCYLPALIFIGLLPIMISFLSNLNF